MHIEFNNITDMLLRNGYPLLFVQNQIRRFLNSKYSESDSHRKKGRRIPRIILKLPSIGDSYLHLEKELKLFFRRYLLGKLSLNVVHGCFKVSDKFKHKEPHPKLLRSNVMYKLTCSCNSVNVGQTRRTLQSRLDEHNPATNSNQQSDVIKHLLENPTLHQF